MQVNTTQRKDAARSASARQNTSMKRKNSMDDFIDDSEVYDMDNEHQAMDIEYTTQTKINEPESSDTDDVLDIFKQAEQSVGDYVAVQEPVSTGQMTDTKKQQTEQTATSESEIAAKQRDTETSTLNPSQPQKMEFKPVITKKPREAESVARPSPISIPHPKTLSSKLPEPAVVSSPSVPAQTTARPGAVPAAISTTSTSSSIGVKRTASPAASPPLASEKMSKVVPPPEKPTSIPAPTINTSTSSAPSSSTTRSVPIPVDAHPLSSSGTCIRVPRATPSSIPTSSPITYRKIGVVPNINIRQAIQVTKELMERNVGNYMRPRLRVRHEMNNAVLDYLKLPAEGERYLIVLYGFYSR
jgi:hypothetical protein